MISFNALAEIMWSHLQMILFLDLSIPVGAFREGNIADIEDAGQQLKNILLRLVLHAYKVHAVPYHAPLGNVIHCVHGEAL